MVDKITTSTVIRSRKRRRLRPNFTVGDVAIIIAPISVTGFSSTVGSMRQAIEAAISEGGEASCSGSMDPGDTVERPDCALPHNIPHAGPRPRDRQ